MARVSLMFKVCLLALTLTELVALCPPLCQMCPYFDESSCYTCVAYAYMPTGYPPCVCSSGYTPDYINNRCLSSTDKYLGYIIGGGVALIIIIVICCCCVRSSKRKKRMQMEAAQRLLPPPVNVQPVIFVPAQQARPQPYPNPPAPYPTQNRPGIFLGQNAHRPVVNYTNNTYNDGIARPIPYNPNQLNPARNGNNITNPYNPNPSQDQVMEYPENSGLQDTEPPRCVICVRDNPCDFATPCGHVFHRSCLRVELQTTNGLCPVCKEPIYENV